MNELIQTFIINTVYTLVNDKLAEYVTLTVCGVKVDPMLAFAFVLFVALKPNLKK